MNVACGWEWIIAIIKPTAGLELTKRRFVLTCFRMSDGESVHRFCKKNDYSYSTFFNAMDNGESFDKALDMAKKAKFLGKSRPKYYYKNKAVVDIFGYQTPAYYHFRSDVRRGYSVSEAVEREFKRTPSLCPGRSTKFFYKGMPLIQFLNDNQKYQRVLRRMRCGKSLMDALALEGA